MKNSVLTPRPLGFRYGIQDEDRYIADLIGYLYLRKNHYFMNDSLGHATLLADLMVGSADSYVLMYTRTAKAVCYQFALQGLPAHVKVRILYEDANCDKWWSTLTSHDIQALHTPSKLTNPPDLDEVNHFFVVDGVAFRYEIDDKKSTASANFNEQSVCLGLSTIFAATWSSLAGKKLDVNFQTAPSKTDPASARVE